MRTTRGSRWMVLPLALVAGLAWAAESTEPGVAEVIAAAPIAAAAQSGQRAYVDPATGKLVPRNETKLAPVPARGKKNFDLMWIETHPDGTLELHTEGQVRSARVASLDAAGERHEACRATPAEHATHDRGPRPEPKQ